MCIFCKIAKGEMPCNKIHENDQFIAFHDIFPKAPVHILIIPKEHIENFQSVSPDTMVKMTPFIQEVAKMMELDENGYRLITNNGPDGGQEVPHLHFHLLGGTKLRWPQMADDTAKKAL